MAWLLATLVFAAGGAVEPGLAAPEVAIAPGPATPRLLLLPSSSFAIRPGLLDALRIQLAGTAGIEIGPVLSGVSTPERVAEAAARAHDGGASLAVWVETSDGGTGAVIFAARRHRERALIQVLTIPAGDAEAERADRILALKIAELSSIALAAPPEILGSAAIGSASPPASDASKVGSRGDTVAFLETGALLALASASFGAQPGLAVAGGVRIRIGALVLEPAIAIRPVRDLESRSESARVALEELSLGAGLRAVAGRPRWEAGGFVELGLRLLDASAVAPDGRTGSSLATVPTVTAGAELRIPAGRRILLRVAAGIETAIRPRHFTVDDKTAARIGRARGVGHFSLVFPVR